MENKRRITEKIGELLGSPLLFMHSSDLQESHLLDFLHNRNNQSSTQGLSISSPQKKKTFSFDDNGKSETRKAI